MTTLHTAATDPALDADHTHSDHMIRYASDCARCVATRALVRAAGEYRLVHFRNAIKAAALRVREELGGGVVMDWACQDGHETLRADIPTDTVRCCSQCGKPMLMVGVFALGPVSA